MCPAGKDYDLAVIGGMMIYSKYPLVIIVFGIQLQETLNVDLDLTRQIALWLISQRNQGGAFISTQDTVVGLQALATYMIWVNQIVSGDLSNFAVFTLSVVNVTIL